MFDVDNTSSYNVSVFLLKLNSTQKVIEHVMV